MIDLVRVRTILAKELLDNARDKKSWLMASTYVIIGPLLLLVIILMAGRILASENTRLLELPVTGGERAPALLEYLKQRNIAPRSGPADPDQAIRARLHAVVLVIAPDYGTDVANGRPATVQLHFDSSQNQQLSQVQRIHDALLGYGATIGHLRLMARGIDPNVVRGIAIENMDAATPYSRATFLFGSIPIFLLMSLFVGSLYIAIDTTAGERERGSLEPLILNPITPAELVLGKLLAVILYSAATVLLALAGFALVLNFAPHEIPRVRMGLSIVGVLWLIAILLPAVVLAAALQIRLSSASRTYKEAQTAGQFLMLLPALPGMVQQLSSVEIARARFWPIIGQHCLIERVLKGDSVPVLDFGVTSLAALGLALLLTLDTIRRYDRGRILFG